MAFEAAIADKELYIYQPDEGVYTEKVGLNVELSREDIAPYVCRTESELFEMLAIPYEMEKLISFREKYIEVDLNYCTETFCKFICKLLMQ